MNSGQGQFSYENTEHIFIFLLQPLRGAGPLQLLPLQLLFHDPRNQSEVPPPSKAPPESSQTLSVTVTPEETTYLQCGRPNQTNKGNSFMHEATDATEGQQLMSTVVGC